MAGLRTGIGLGLASRLVAWAFAAGAYLAFGTHATNPARYDPSGVASPLSGAADALVGVWARWDSVWYLGIVEGGYGADGHEPAFFPLYPLATWLAGGFAGRAAAAGAGVAVSLAALLAALWLLHRLVELESDRETATLTVALLAFFPTAVFFSTVYSESLFLALSVAAVWFARTDRWALAGIAGCLAAATRSAGVLLLVPLVLLYLLGPRGTGNAAKPYLGISDRRSGGRLTHPIRAEMAWLALVPIGLAAYMAYLWARTGSPVRFVEAQGFWQREAATLGPLPLGPVAGLVEGVAAGLEGLWSLVVEGDALALWQMDGGPVFVASQNVELAGFLAFGVVATVGALRRLPLAYGAYAACLLAFPLTWTADEVPLFSLSRFLVVVFPLFMWLALWSRERRLGVWVTAAFALLLALYSARWGTWQWVA